MLFGLILKFKTDMTYNCHVYYVNILIIKKPVIKSNKIII